MSGQLAVTLYVAAMVGVIVAVDVLVFRERFWARLIANVAIVAAFGVFYIWFIRGA